MHFRYRTRRFQFFDGLNSRSEVFWSCADCEPPFHPRKILEAIFYKFNIPDFQLEVSIFTLFDTFFQFCQENFIALEIRQNRYVTQDMIHA